MTWKGGFDGKGYTLEDFKQYVETLPKVPWAKKLVLHNTGAPNITQWQKTPGGSPQRIKNLEAFYKAKWSGGPHLFIAPEGLIFLGTPLTLTGVHSPSWNSSAWGMEMAADFSAKHDDDDAGTGLAIKNLACEAIAVLMTHQGLDITNDTIKLHKEDHKTTHDCPGVDVEKPDILSRIKAYADELGEAGEHNPDEVLPSVANTSPVLPRIGYVNTDDLNLRDISGMSGKVIASLPIYTPLNIWHESTNKSTLWYEVGVPSQGYIKGWVYGLYVSQGVPPANTAPEPSTPPQDVSPTPSDLWIKPEDPLFKVSQFGVDWAKRFEGLALEAYWDVSGYAIGYGHNGGSGVAPIPHKGDKISEAQATQILDNDLALQVHYLRTWCKVALKQCMIDALALDFFQQGPGNERKHIIPTLNEGKYSEVSDLIRNRSTVASGVVAAGLKRRYGVIADIFDGKAPTKW